MVAEGSGGTLTTTDIPRTEGGGVYHCPLAQSTVHEVLSFTYGPSAGDAVTVNWVDAGCSVFTVSRGATGPTPVPGHVGQKTAVYLAPANLSSILAPLWSGQQP